MQPQSAERGAARSPMRSVCASVSPQGSRDHTMTSQATSMDDRLKADRQWRQLHMQLRRIEQALKPQCLPERFETPGHSIALAGRLADQLERSSGPALTTERQRESGPTLTEQDQALVVLLTYLLAASETLAELAAKAKVQITVAELLESVAEIALNHEAPNEASVTLAELCRAAATAEQERS